MSIDEIQAAEMNEIRTQSVQQAGGLVQWTVTWKSTTGDLQDLSGTDVVDILTWEGLPPEFGTSNGAWTSSGMETGLGLHGSPVDAAQGQATFGYPIMPTDVNYSGHQLKDGETGSDRWETTGFLGHGVYGTYVHLDEVAVRLVRYLERRGRDLVANCQFTDPTGATNTFSDVVIQELFAKERIELDDEIEDEMPEAMPQTVDWSLVEAWNQEAMKAMEQGDEIRYFIFHERLLLDGSADQPVGDYINFARINNSGNSAGRLRMTKKGTLFDPGSVTVTWAGGWEATIKEAIAGFSKKKVIFE
ncbi:MAG: hypothetical protein KGQ66_23250 [Acidobacteriota bacterium]|nr:hypothetical protein [Acidobacteriota bacterium]